MKTITGFTRGEQTPVGVVLLIAVALVVMWLATSAQAASPVASGLLGASGSTVGPDRALYVTEGMVGRLSRVDPASGEVTTVAEGLPPAVLPVGGAIDVAFLDGVAYVLVTLVGAPLGAAIDGIYRVDGNGQFTVVADIGSFAASHPPQTGYLLPQGVQYSIEAHRGGFLVADGHHNRILRVELDGSVSVAHAFGNIVPTGLETLGDTVYVARAGAVPHLPAEGRILAIESRSGDVSEVAAGAPLLVDVERGRGRTLFGLAQGYWSPGQIDGTPADPDTGSLVRANDQGGFDVIETGLDRPTSLEVIGNDAYVITLTGAVLRISDIASAPYGASSGP
jgi:hypothetical protein